MENPRQHRAHQHAGTEGMPSPRTEAPTARQAAEQLRSYADIRDRSSARRPPRALLLLELWTAVMMTAYLATALTTAGRYDSPYHLLLPLGVMTLLSAGARERFAVRKHPRRRYRAGQCVAVLTVLVLGILRIRDIPYPGWVDALVLLAVFAALAAGPFRQWRLPADRAQHTGPALLTTPARLNTVMVAALLGFLMATVVWQHAWLIAIAFLVLGVIELARSNTRWGLRSTGHDWAPVHWAACCTGVLLLFALILLRISTDVLAPPWCIAIGSVFSVAMAATALLPWREAR